MSNDAYEEYKQCFKELEEDVRRNKEKLKSLMNASERGKLLEKMAGLLFFDGNALFNKAINCRTVTNEIDILVNWNKIALQLGLNKAYTYMGDSFLCECKNYSNPVDVTYIGKFYSLMKTCNVKFGILFSRDGMSGTNIWINGKGLARKIALRENIYIIDISFKDFERIYKRETNILGIIDDKFISMKNDIEYENYLSTHEMEEQFKNELSIRGLI